MRRPCRTPSLRLKSKSWEKRLSKASARLWELVSQWLLGVCVTSLPQEKNSLHSGEVGCQGDSRRKKKSEEDKTD